MAQDFSYAIEGLDVVQKMLKTLPQTVQDKTLYNVFRSAANIVKQEIEQAAPDGDNSKKSKNKIANNIIVKKDKRSSTGVLIGFHKRAFAARFFIKGTKVRQTKGKGKYKAGANRGEMQRNDFLTPAHTRATPKVIEYVSKNYLSIVNRSLKAQARRLNKGNK